MSVLSIKPPFPVFTDTSGQPLEDGFIYIGVANQDPVTNQITVYWDEALTIPASQPIRTIAGYPSRAGTPAVLYVSTDYSIVVKNKTNALMYQSLSTTERYGGGVIPSSDVTYLPAGSGAVQTNVQAKLRETVSVKDFGAVGDGVANDTDAIQAAIAAATAGKKLVFANGTYKITSTLTFTNINVDFGNSIILYDGAKNVFALVLNSSVTTFTTGYIFENLTLQCTSTDIVDRTHGICLGGGLGYLRNCRVIGFTGVSLGLGNGVDSHTGVTFPGASDCYYWNIECQVSSTAGWNLVIPFANNANLFTQFSTFPYNGFNESPPRTANCIDEVVINGTGNTFVRASLEASPSNKVVVFGSGAQQNSFLGTTYIEFNASWNHGAEPYVSVAAEAASNTLIARCSNVLTFASDLGANNNIQVTPGFYINGTQVQAPGGSVNLIKNGDFENGTVNWSDFSTGSVLSIVPGFAKGKALRIDTTAGRPNVAQNLTVGGVNAQAFVGQNVTVSYWARTNFANATLRLQGLRQRNIPSDEQWHYNTSTIKITSAAATLSIITESTGVTGYIEVSDIVVTLGRTPVAIAPPTNPDGSATYNPPSLGTGTRATTTVTVTGAALGDFVLPSFGLDLQGVELSAYVSAADTVTCVFSNDTGGTVDLGSSTLRCRVIKA